MVHGSPDESATARERYVFERHGIDEGYGESNMSVMRPESRSRHTDVRNRRLTGGQVKAIRLAAEIGDDIRKNYPEIAEEYRSGLTAPRMVDAHDFDRRYGVSRPAAIGAVRNAIRGYFGPYHERYDGLIADRPERKRLAVSHNSRTGTELYEQKRGIHAMTHEQRVAVGRKGGLIRGPLSYELRIGCHAMSPEVLREHCRRSCTGRRQGGRRGFSCGQRLGPLYTGDARKGCRDRVRVVPGGGPTLPGPGTREFQKNRGKSERGVPRRQSPLYANNSKNRASTSP